MILFNKNIRINIDPNVVNHVEILLEYGMLELCKTVVIIINLEDEPRSTPGHSKVFNQISAIMKFMVFASMVCIPGLTLELLSYEETLLKDPKLNFVLSFPF